MFPDLSYFLHYVFGTQPDNWTAIFKTFGLFLGMCFFVSAYILYIEFKRKEKEGLLTPRRVKVVEGQGPNWTEGIINSLIVFFLGFKIPYIASHFEDFKTDGAGMVFSSKGNIGIGILFLVLSIGYFLWNKNKAKQNVKKEVFKNLYPHQRVGDITVVAAIFGILGSRLFSIFENMESFFRDPLGQLFSGSGLTIYGGLILAFIAVYYYVKKNGIPPIHVMDAVAPALIVGYGVGRLGCQFSGDGDWGIVNELAKPGWFFLPDWLWSYSYPHNVLNEGIPIVGCEFIHCSELSPGVFPTPIYETFFCLLIFLILWALRKRLHVAGALFFVYMILNGIERFFIEKIRVNEKYDFLGLDLSQAQYIAIAFILVGIGALVYLYKFKKKEVKT